ncbi:hypothetical protein CLOM_g877 [Closterium sp. NIES-68]|nr:hypothetical protein CLOM_g877 [Closterium sp. NIES-68]GJP65928.1 hypothetical protein CLOP_g22825 [Closterium sp. NIES-67]
MAGATWQKAVLLFVFSVALYIRDARAWFQPTPGTTFYWQLSNSNPNVDGSIDTTDPADVYDVDGFSVPPSTIAYLQAAGKKVVCYFSFGTYESYRPDSKSFPKRVKKGRVCLDRWCLKWWPGERWLNVKDPVVKRIMEKRVQLAASKGCDGIEPDNIDAYSNRLNKWLLPFTRSVRITKKDQIRYNSWIADTVHKHGMSVGLKNALTIAAALVSKYDWALVEECNAFSDWSSGGWYKGKYECDYVNVFIKANKAVFVAEYTSAWGTAAGRVNGIQFPQRLCADNNAHGFSTRLHDLDLGPTKFPWADCLQHQPAGCAAAAWQLCIQPTVYAGFNQPGEGMSGADQIGQCVRSKISSCTYE